MTGTLKIPGVDAPPIKNGLRQGCCMAPILFNLFMWAVFQQWHCAVANIPSIGIPVATNPGGSLPFSRKPTDKTKVHCEYQFEDDTALLATTHHGAQRALDQFIVRRNYWSVGDTHFSQKIAFHLLGEYACTRVSS